MKKRPFDVVAIGGSAGSLPVLMDILERIPDNFCVPIILIIHRMKNVPSEMNKILSVGKKISEPEDKEQIQECCIYLAPQNYHLLVEEDKSFSLDYSELVHYSRPSIDVSLISISSVYKKRTLGILLSGANRDGANGLDRIINVGGIGIIQDPETAEYPAMPRSAYEYNNKVKVLTPSAIVEYITKVIV